MPKVNKVYPSFYNGVSEQPAELMLDTNCKDMVNCVPSLITGLRKRPPCNYIASLTNFTDDYKVIHTYDRGEDDEEYIFVYTGETDRLRIFNKDAQEMNIILTSGEEADIRSYLNTSNLKCLTVQDRTWIVNKDISVDIDYSTTSPLSSNYDKVAYYWLKRGSGDRYNPYNYAVYINGQTVAVDPNKASSSDLDPATGAEDSDVSASLLAAKINANVVGFQCDVIGSLLKIYRDNGADFTFSSWDSWGNQASEGWKGSVNKITDLPKDMAFSNVYVQITGGENSNYNDYYVKWNGSSWEECLDPTADRGSLINMPLALDRTGVNEFTIKKLDWIEPKVGNLDNNPDPSFVGSSLTDIFFYKNRLGLASSDSVVLSKTASYEDFYIKTVIDILDTDPIDISIASNKASKIYYAKPFNNSLYIFTKDSQFELQSESYLSPKSVSINIVTNYPMAIDVEPQVVNSSLYFISTTGNKQQLREYIKNEKLTVEGVDLNITTPNYLSETITGLIANGVLGYVICTTDSNVVYLYSYKESNNERPQSGWSKWEILEDLETVEGSYQYHILDASMIVTYKTEDRYIYNILELDNLYSNDNEDTSYLTTHPYTSSVLLPDFYPHVKDIGSPKDKILLKKIKISGEGDYDVELYRKDYNKTYYKYHTDSATKDLDVHVASKVDNVDITIKASTANGFVLNSIVMEGLYSPTSKEIK